MADKIEYEIIRRRDRKRTGQYSEDLIDKMKPCACNHTKILFKNGTTMKINNLRFDIVKKVIKYTSLDEDEE